MSEQRYTPSEFAVDLAAHACREVRVTFAYPSHGRIATATCRCGESFSTHEYQTALDANIEHAFTVAEALQTDRINARGNNA